VVDNRNSGGACSNPPGVLVVEAVPKVLGQRQRSEACVEPALLREILKSSRIRAMNEVSTDTPGLPFGDKPLDGLDRACTNKFDLEIREMLIEPGNQSGHRAGRQ